MFGTFSFFSRPRRFFKNYKKLFLCACKIFECSELLVVSNERKRLFRLKDLFFFSKSITNFFIWLKIKKGFAWLGVPGQCSKRCTKVFLFKKLIFLWVEKNFCVEICLIGCFRLVKMQPAYSNSRTDKTCFEIKFKDKSSHIHMEVVIRGIKIDIV